MPKTLLTAALLALAISAHAAAEANKSGFNHPFEGYAYGENHCYAFTAPQGWSMDNTALAAAGVPMTFLPGEQTGLRDVRIYTRPAERSIAEQVADTIALYQDEAKQPSASKEAEVTGKNGAKGELWHYTGYPTPGIEEMVVYFPGKQTLNFFVLQLGPKADHAVGKAALLELAASYYERDNCAPCAQSTERMCGTTTE